MSALAQSTEGAPVGEQLRAWRQARNLSQLEVALEAQVSARHVSFLETTAQGLAIEAFYPADARTANLLLGTLG